MIYSFEKKSAKAKAPKLLGFWRRSYFFSLQEPEITLHSPICPTRRATKGEFIKTEKGGNNHEEY